MMQFKVVDENECIRILTKLGNMLVSSAKNSIRMQFLLGNFPTLLANAREALFNPDTETGEWPV